MEDKRKIEEHLKAFEKSDRKLFATWVDVNHFELLVVTDEEYLYLLEFVTRKNKSMKSQLLQKKLEQKLLKVERK